MSVVAGEWTWVQVIVVGLAGLAMRCAAMETPGLEELLVAAVIDALHAAHITVKDAAYHMRIDEEQLRRQLSLKPQQYLALNRIIRLPFTFWLFFGPSLIALVWKKRMQEMAEALNDVRRA